MKKAPRPRIPGEDAPDDHVVGPGLVAEGAEEQRHGGGGGEQPEPEVGAEGQGGHRAGEGDMAERVAGEDLGAQHQEVADQSAGRGDDGPGEEGVQEERVGQGGGGERDGHATTSLAAGVGPVPRAAVRSAPARPANSRSAPQPKASRYPAKAMVVTKKPRG